MVLTEGLELPRAESDAWSLDGLSIVLPCLNEAENVGEAIREARAAAARWSRAHEVIVVDDGSTDDTAYVTASLARRHADVRLVVHPVNRGYGAAVRSGIAAARLPWVLVTDGDLQFNLDDLEAFLGPAQRADVVLGRRRPRRDPLMRRVNATAWNWLVRRSFHLPVHDVDCAFKLMRADLLADLPLEAEGAMISTELLVKALARGARLVELDVRHRRRVRGKQSGADPKVVLRAFVELARLRRELRVASRCSVEPQAAGVPFARVRRADA